MSYIYRTFLKGLLAILPLLITIYLLIWIVTQVEGLFGGPLRSWLPPSLYFPGAGLVVVILMIFLAGLLVSNYLTNRFMSWMEHRLDRMPIIRSIYNPIRDLTHLFTQGSSGHRGSRVVMVRMGPGAPEAMGLVTRDHFEDLPLGTIPPEHVTVFFPFSYGVGGFTAVVNRANLRETSLAAEKAMQLAITGWIAPTQSADEKNPAKPAETSTDSKI